MPTDNGYRRTALMIFYTTVITVAVFLFYKYLLYWFLPFAFGWLIADMIQAPMNTLYIRLRLPKKVSGAVFVLLVVAAVIAVIALVSGGVYSLLRRLYGYLSENYDDITSMINGLFDKCVSLAERFDLFEGDSGSVRQSFSESLMSGFSGLIAFIPTIFTAIATLVPKLFVFFILLIISAYYFATDFERINVFVVRLIEKKNRPLVIEIKNQLIFILKQFTKSYFVLAVVCFSELYLGFTLLGIRYAFQTALIVSVIDALPILGVGTVLLPWTVVELIRGDTTSAIILLVLYGVVTLVRQLLEPKLLGSMTGIHPLLSLASLFLGLRLMGVFGMFFVPISVIAVKNLYIKGYFNKTKSS